MVMSFQEQYGRESRLVRLRQVEPPLEAREDEDEDDDGDFVDDLVDESKLLRLTDHMHESGSAQRQETAAEAVLFVGSRVCVRSAPNAKSFGRKGTVVATQQLRTGRAFYTVELDDGEIETKLDESMLKPERLVREYQPPPPPPPPPHHPTTPPPHHPTTPPPHHPTVPGVLFAGGGVR